MRYIDSGERNPKQALGTWLGDVLLKATPVTALRVQTGFFGSDALGYFETALDALRQDDGHTRFLVGSNDGVTSRAAVADLLHLAGPPRSGQRLGVVSFQNGFFHPKVFHFQRADGSSTAYVGSANLTGAGVTSLHVEAGVILDTADGDPHRVLDSIGEAIDAWFSDSRPGLYEIYSEGDLDTLVDARVLGVPPPPQPSRRVHANAGGSPPSPSGHSLQPLVAIPPIHASLSGAPQGTRDPSTGIGTQTAPTAGSATSSTRAPQITAAPRAVIRHWSKKLSASDAQRRSGHQSALIALTQGDYRGQIDHTKFFRDDMFSAETWFVEHTTSQAPLEVAYIAMHVTVDGVDHGELVFRISHAPHRESGTNSPTTEIHLEPILPLFAQIDFTGKRLDLERLSDGTYELRIS